MPKFAPVLALLSWLAIKCCAGGKSGRALLRKVLDEVDTDKDGAFSLQELETVYFPLEKQEEVQAQKQQFEWLFKVVDEDRDQRLGTKELLALMLRMEEVPLLQRHIRDMAKKLRLPALFQEDEEDDGKVYGFSTLEEGKESESPSLVEAEHSHGITEQSPEVLILEEEEPGLEAAEEVAKVPSHEAAEEVAKVWATL